MNNLFTATGHVHYAKCMRLYLKNMSELETNYPLVYMSFGTHGYYTVIHSDRYWAELWSDLIIEQVLMQSLKSRSGLTAGRGVGVLKFMNTLVSLLISFMLTVSTTLS